MKNSTKMLFAVITVLLTLGAGLNELNHKTSRDEVQQLVRGHCREVCMNSEDGAILKTKMAFVEQILTEIKKAIEDLRREIKDARDR